MGPLAIVGTTTAIRNETGSPAAQALLRVAQAFTSDLGAPD